MRPVGIDLTVTLHNDELIVLQADDFVLLTYNLINKILINRTFYSNFHITEGNIKENKKRKKVK